MPGGSLIELAGNLGYRNWRQSFRSALEHEEGTSKCSAAALRPSAGESWSLKPE